MHIKTLLNHVTKFKGFVFQNPKLCRDSDKLLIPIEPRKNSKPICSLCGHPGATYDHLKQREFLLPPIWNIVVVLFYTMRQSCCGASPLGDGKISGYKAICRFSGILGKKIVLERYRQILPGFLGYCCRCRYMDR